MAIVRFKGYGETEVPVGTSILEAAQKIDAPEGYACGGVCARRRIVTAGDHDEGAA